MNALRSWTLVVAVLAAGMHAAGAAERTPRVHALVGARVVVKPGTVLEGATVIVRDGIVTAVGNVNPPADARIWDLHGRTIYPGLVEAYYVPAAERPADAATGTGGRPGRGGGARAGRDSGARAQGPRARKLARTSRSACDVQARPQE
jgi:hypothetical protein